MVYSPAFAFRTQHSRVMSSLTEKQKHYLRGLGHKLKPVVIIGAQGYTAAVRNELDLSLARHELLKVRVSAGDRAARDALIEQMCEESTANLIQRIGNIALLYRRHPDKPRVALPRPAPRRIVKQ
jgi:RNA-binding protein